MENTSKHHQALFETTSRLISHLVNEGLCFATIKSPSSNGNHWLCLNSRNPTVESNVITRMKVAMPSITSARLDCAGRLVSLIRPSQLTSPVILERERDSWEELDPAVIWDAVYCWLYVQDEDRSIKDLIHNQLENATKNQGIRAPVSDSTLSFNIQP